MGLDAWHISSKERPDLIVTLNDGPCGVRKPAQDAFINQSNIYEATCCPSPSALAASFDKNICYENGALLASDCKSKQVNVLLGPGVNIKRSVLCGRNFEYWSEDPYLSGRLAASYINGLEDNCVSSCIKHFTCNNKEFARLLCSSEVSLRALNEIYLRSFSYAFRYSSPSSLMTSYNRVNGEYVNESKYLMVDKLKNDLSYKGLIISDWGAVSNKARTIKCGLHVEMPISTRSFYKLDEDLDKNIFTEKNLIDNDKAILEFTKKFAKTYPENGFDKHVAHIKAVEIANETPVLVKNDGLLPLNQNEKILVVGYLANKPRFVGGGSAYVEAFYKTTYIDVLKNKNIDYLWARAFDEKRRVAITEKQLNYYKNKGYKKAVVFFGTLPEDESEGMDRKNIEIRKEQIEVFDILRNVYDDIISVVISGSVLNIEKVYSESKSVLISYLAGEGQAEAIFNNLYGIHNPSGRLPETWISSLSQAPLYDQLIKHNSYYEYYDEDIFIGYRYYIDHQNGFMLPFGYGLSYTKFNYKNINVTNTNDHINISLTISNQGDLDGDEIVQIYASKENSNIYRAPRELIEFLKVHLAAKEEKTIEFSIPLFHLNAYDINDDKMKIEDGIYNIYVAKNSFDIISKNQIYVEGETFKENKEVYKLIRKNLDPIFTHDTSLGNVSLINWNLLEIFFKQIKTKNINDIHERIYWNDGCPIRDLANSNLLTFDELDDFIKYLNSLNINDAFKVDDI